MNNNKDEDVDFEKLEEQIEDAMLNNRTSEVLGLLSFLSEKTIKKKNKNNNPFKI